MAKKHLNAEEIAELRECPFISNIISGRITFTPEFKKMAYHQLIDGKSMRMIFEENTVETLISKHGSTLDNEIIVHSDQGCHYTSYDFIEKLKDADFVQSMSRKGNCWDNVPQESFFGHMKDEIKDIIPDCGTLKDVVALIDDWIDYYNNDRGQ